ncbi:MAG TPA: hypothetical protein VNJ46_09395, partial [Gaiellaceae bacterium]|nr:hypothetical protein [Gaiellaceae bacterium]
MDRKRLGAALAIAGLVVLVVSALADVLGYGQGGFGWKQTVGVIAGAAALLAGLALARWKGGGAGAPAAGR